MRSRTYSAVALIALVGCAGGEVGSDAGDGFPDAQRFPPDERADARPFPDGPDAAPFGTSVCTEDLVVQCGTSGDGYMSMRSDGMSGYSCQAGPATTQDLVVRYSPATTGMTVVTLDVDFDEAGVGDEMDLYLLAGSCASTSCMMQANEAGDDQLQFMATGGETYYVAVEWTRRGVLSPGAYSLSVACP